MKSSSFKFVIAFCVASILLARISANESIRFGYSGKIGPDKWGSLNPEWKLCNSGHNQSPINIVTNEVKPNSSLEALTRNYVNANATLVNNGYNVELKFNSGGGTVLVDGKNYTLLQMHWHSPSEHTFNGQRYPVELHLVHKSTDGGIAVVSILYQLGHADTFVLQFQDSLKELAQEKCGEDEESHIDVGTVQIKAMKRASHKYYRYVGSLTIPPCTENVIWTVMGRVREMTKDQAALLNAPLSIEFQHNARPTQALNGRVVTLFQST